MRIRAKRAAYALFLLATFAATPALVAPWVSEEPVLWAYRAYHPLMYRYPKFPRLQMADAQMTMAEKPRWEQSFEILGIMVKYW